MVQQKGMSVKEAEALLGTLSGPALEAMLQSFAEDERKSIQTMVSRWKKKIEKERVEAARMEAMWEYENKAKANGYLHIAGTDEVGRGPLAGPVVAAAVILPEDANLPGIKDSKKLSEQQRNILDAMIREQAIAYAIVEVDHKTIDEINILEASRLAMRKAVDQLSVPADFVLVDGLPNPRIQQPSEAIVKGDNKSISVAAAAIIAKVYRDRLMADLDRMYPGYGLADHKGYPTASHIEAVRQLGPSPIHRLSFEPIRSMLEKE